MKIVKKTWIAILALATAIVAACTSAKHVNEDTTGGSASADGDGLNVKNNDKISADSISARRAELQARLEKLRATIRDREMSCVYGSPEVIQSYSADTRAMRHEADSLQKVLLDMLESEKDSLYKRLKSIDETVNGRSGEKVYGPPEMINKYNARNKDLREKHDSLQNEIDKIDREIYNIKNNNRQ